LLTSAPIWQLAWSSNERRKAIAHSDCVIACTLNAPSAREVVVGARGSAVGAANWPVRRAKKAIRMPTVVTSGRV